MDYTENINHADDQETKVSEPMFSVYQAHRHKSRTTCAKSQPSCIQNPCEEEALKPYTMEELNARIDRAEADVKDGRVMSRAEASHKMKEHIAQYMQI